MELRLYLQASRENVLTGNLHTTVGVCTCISEHYNNTIRTWNNCRTKHKKQQRPHTHTHVHSFDAQNSHIHWQNTATQLKSHCKSFSFAMTRAHDQTFLTIFRIVAFALRLHFTICCLQFNTMSRSVHLLDIVYLFYSLVVCVYELNFVHISICLSLCCLDLNCCVILLLCSILRCCCCCFCCQSRIVNIWNQHLDNI